ncbi:hypothetical protein S7711_06505 [Stachybotrys chartarum IBT 7711]|uniref:Uncharacterized protein n=1 Tax=Stachybotrys chartarum (strain CBS 109288 / IBT 7711) TaxID=1280523 RepID=A0A084BB89_STACB|nr:hypothetical protein S7711_06505 [Stachybotrys chartarum IBT 7711]
MVKTYQMPSSKSLRDADEMVASSGEASQGDIVFPIHEFDDSPVNRFSMHWTLRFDAVLDTDKLCASLEYLLNLEGWKKLGGRLHLSAEDKIEIRTPRVYTKQRPPFQFSKQVFAGRTLDHPVAKNLPRARGKAELFPGIAWQFNPLTIGPEWALDFANHVARREPILGIHVALFDDATLISIRWVHVVCDYMGMKGLLLAWTMALHERYEDIPPFLGAYEDPLKRVGASPSEEPYVLADMQLTPDAFKKTYDRYLEHVEAYPTTVRRMFVLPPWALRRIKMDFIGGSSSDKLEILPKGALFNGQFVSDGDILAVWSARLCCGILPAARDRPVLIMGMYEARSCLPDIFPRREDKPSASPFFVANATFSTYSNTTLRTLRQEPLVKTALVVRQAVASQTRAPQVHALLHRLREAAANAPENPAVYAREDSWILVSSNFSKMDYFNAIDFSPAVVATAAEDHGASPGKIAWHQWTTLEHTIHIRNQFQVGGRDAKGNTWMMAILPPETWAVVEAHLASLSDDAVQPKPPGVTVKPEAAERSKL